MRELVSVTSLEGGLRRSGDAGGTGDSEDELYIREKILDAHFVSENCLLS